MIHLIGRLDKVTRLPGLRTRSAWGVRRSGERNPQRRTTRWRSSWGGVALPPGRRPGACSGPCGGRWAPSEIGVEAAASTRTRWLLEDARAELEKGVVLLEEMTRR